MARRPRRTPSATYKAPVASTALWGDKTIAQIAEKFEIHPNQVTDWKDRLLERSSEPFGEKADGAPAPNIEKMEAKIGRLTSENDFLESVLMKAGLPSAKR
jgi:transposase